MSIIVSSVVILLMLGVVFGVGLAMASKRFAVQVDPKIEAIDGALPQLNCGACGCAGCLAYAEAIAGGGMSISLCIPGGREVAEGLAEITGIELEEIKPVRAYVHCQGGTCEAVDAFEYHGVSDCRAAALVQGGPKKCKYGCLGFGTCADVCPTNAITMTEDGLPVVDFARCTGCGLCVRACPRDIISVLPLGTTVYLGCSSPERGAAVKKICSVGCISCRICAKVTGSGAIVMEKEDALPKLSYQEDEDFEAAYAKCPMHCFVKATPTQSVDFDALKVIRTPKKKAVASAS